MAVILSQIVNFKLNFHILLSTQRVNDLAEHTTSTVRLFADDCVMYKSVKSVRDCQELQQDLIQLQAWQERWLLRFNPRKCNIMRATHATRKKIEFPYTLDDTPLADTPSTSYLGVELSSDLRWNKQVKKTVAKGNQTLGVLKRNLRHCPRSIKDMAYKTILRLKWNMLLLSGTHSLRTTYANWKLYRGGQLDLSATATGRLQV